MEIQGFSYHLTKFQIPLLHRFSNFTLVAPLPKSQTASKFPQHSKYQPRWKIYQANSFLKKEKAHWEHLHH